MGTLGISIEAKRSGGGQAGRINWTIVFGLFALSNLIVGGWALVDPVHWYYNLPGDVPASGPLNEHFVRDIGAIFAVAGVALTIAVLNTAWRMPVLVGVTGWYAAHAVVHVVDTWRGLFKPDRWLLDTPVIYAPVAILIAVIVLYRRADAD
jgi:hypothetical protein